MEKYKGLILLIVVIINLKSLSSCSSSNGVVNRKNEAITTRNENQMNVKDTLFLSIKDYKILSLDENVLDIEVINNQLASLIKSIKYSIIKIELQEGDKIAKGNALLSSSIPKECDFIYPINNGYIFTVNNKISFRRIAK